VGVAATDDVEALFALEADCVLYMPSVFHIDELCRMLESGTNVVTTCSALFHPRRGLSEEVADRLEAACLAGGTSLHGTGSSPGFITDVLPLALLSIERSVRTFKIEEFADLSSRTSPELLFDLMGMGARPGADQSGRTEHLRTSFAPSLLELADLVGVPIDSVEADSEVAVTTRAVEIAAGTIEEGCVGAQRTNVVALSDGEPRFSFHATWYCTDAIAADWETRETGWRVSIDGDVPMAVDIFFPVDPERLSAVTPGYTAHRPVNVVAAVCQAPPGFVSSAQLPAMTTRFLDG
jgi:hypothetical protein